MPDNISFYFNYVFSPKKEGKITANLQLNFMLKNFLFKKGYLQIPFVFEKMNLPEYLFPFSPYQVENIDH